MLFRSDSNTLTHVAHLRCADARPLGRVSRPRSLSERVHSARAAVSNCDCRLLRLSRSQIATKVVVSKAVIAEIVLRLLAPIHHEPGACGASQNVASTTHDERFA
eukprot:3498234-Pleurochrysis_carterae.AAC.1